MINRRKNRVLDVALGLLLFILNGWADDPITITLTTNAVVQDVKRLGLNIRDTYYNSPVLKMRDSKNFEGSVYRQVVKGILTTNGIISYYGKSHLMEPTGWQDLYTNGAVFEVVSGPDKGLTGLISAVTFDWYDIWNNSNDLRYVPFFEFDRPVNLGAETSIRDMGVLVEDLSRTGEGHIGSISATSDHWISRTGVTPTHDNPPGVSGVSCARMDGSSEAVHIRMASMYQSLADGNGNWNLHFWVKAESGSPTVEVYTGSDDANFTTHIVPSGSWQKVELLIPVTVQDKIYPESGMHTFVIEVDGGVARVDQVEVWKDGYTNATAFTDDFVDAMREMNVGVLRQVLMGGNTVSNWIVDPWQGQAGTFRADYDIGPYGNRSGPSIGFHSFMGLCEEVGAEPWMCLPGAIHSEEVAMFVDYLAGPTNTPGGELRAQLGRAIPWTETFNDINLEFGNEAWNTVNWYNFSGFNGADYWHDLIAVGKASTSYTNSIKFHAAGQNFSSSMTENILNDATNADNYAIATYMIHSVETNDNWVFDWGDYEAQFKWFLGYPMHKIFEKGMPEQWDAITNATADAEFSMYEFNYHSADFNKATNALGEYVDPSWTNVRDEVNVFLPSICHGLSIANSMLAQLKKVHMRTQCFFVNTGFDNFDGGRVFGASHVYKAEQERHRPAFYTLALANKVLRGDLVETVLETNMQFASYGVFDGDDPETNYYDTLYSYAFRDGVTNGLILFNYDLTSTQTVRLALADYVKDDTAEQWILSTPAYTNSNEPELPSPQVLPVGTNITFSGGAEIVLAPFSMQVLQWEADGVLPQIVVSTNSLILEEGGATNFMVQLSSQPRSSVTVAVSQVFVQNMGVAIPSVNPVFTTNNWNVSQSVTLQSSEDDSNYTNGTATIHCAATGMEAVDVAVTERENDIYPGYLLPFAETFDPGAEDMADGLGNLDGQHGWRVEDYGAATVQSNEVYAGSQAAALSAATALHSFSNGADTVNIALYAKPVFGPEQLGLEQSGWSAVFYINSNLHVVAYSNQTPVEITSVSASNDWNQLDVTSDYTSQIWGLELNGTALFTNFAFYSARPTFSRIAVRDVVNTTTSYVDSISITTTLEDSDGDGLPDAWEQTYWGSLSPEPGNLASNGINTLIEAYIAGLNPTDSGARFEISAIGPLQWNTASGRVYSIYWTSNLLNEFQTLETNLTTGIFTDTLHTAEQQGFYQIKVQIP